MRAVGARSIVLETLVNVAKYFAAPSVPRVKMNQAQHMNYEDILIDRLSKQETWDSIKHFILIFQEGGSITPMYRDQGVVPKKLKGMLQTQNSPLKEYHNMSHSELLQELRQIVCSNPMANDITLRNDYAVTADNMLKMVLITLRVEARLPVVLMGHTGCGKTSLLEYLATLRRAKLLILNCHAGTSSTDIRNCF